MAYPSHPTQQFTPLSLCPPWYPPQWAPPPPPQQSVPASYPPRAIPSLSHYLTKRDPLVLLILVLATHDVSWKWERMAEVSHLLPDHRLWMDDGNDLGFQLFPFVDLAEELREILESQAYVNPWDYCHPGARSAGRRRNGNGSRTDEGGRIRRRYSDSDVRGGSDRGGRWKRNLNEAEQAGRAAYILRQLSRVRRIANWQSTVSPVPPSTPPTPPRSANMSVSRGRRRRRSSLANNEGDVGIMQSIEEDYSMETQNRQSSDNDKIHSLSDGSEDERKRRSRSYTPFVELAARPTRVRFGPVRSFPAETDSVSSMSVEAESGRPRSQSDPFK